MCLIRIFLLSMMLVVTSNLAMARDYTWMIGGGYDLQSSQAQIEKNVIWAADIIRRQAPEQSVTIFFTDGKDPLKDVLEWRPVDDSDDNMMPLARIYDSYVANGERYRNHVIDGVAGSTDTDVMLPELIDGFSALQPGDRVLLIYNGHGGRQSKDPLTNVMWLWNDSSLDVRDVDELFENIDSAVPIRFVFTQCYSGGFAELARRHENACGFMSVPPDRQAEGCSAGVDIGDYRDYSTFFFAALDGKTRTSDSLKTDPDMDRDGKINLYEAHLYALRVAVSSDLPRSTSEAYLLDWRPWYQWLFAPDNFDNQYARLSRDLKQRWSLKGTTDLKKQRRQWQKEYKELQSARSSLRKEITRLSTTLQTELEKRWPGIAYAYTSRYVEYINSELDATQAYLMQNSTYTRLVSKQKEYQQLKKHKLAKQRELMQLNKIEYLDTLARTHAYFVQHASERERAEYQRILACEKTTL